MNTKQYTNTLELKTERHEYQQQQNFYSLSHNFNTYGSLLGCHTLLSFLSLTRSVQSNRFKNFQYQLNICSISIIMHTSIKMGRDQRTDTLYTMKIFFFISFKRSHILYRYEYTVAMTQLLYNTLFFE